MSVAAGPPSMNGWMAPAPPTPKRDPPAWRSALIARKCNISGWSARAYDEMVVRSRMLGGSRSVLINEPAVARSILALPDEVASRPVIIDRLLRPAAGEGLSLSKGDLWRRQRRILAPAFTPRSLDVLVPQFRAAADTAVARLAAQGRVNLAAAVHQLGLDGACRGMFSAPLEGRGARLGALLEEYIRGPGRPNGTDYLARDTAAFEWANPSRRRFSALWFREIDELIAERRVRRASDPATTRDMLDLLLSARQSGADEPLADSEVRDQVGNMVLGGFETTARTMFWALYLLARSPGVQAQVSAEVMALPTARMSALSDLAAWPALRRVLLETLRLYPPISLILRRLSRRFHEDGLRLEAGELVVISPWVMHRHRRLWQEPAAFDPERFVGAEAHALSRDERYLPFGGGLRICIGANFAMAQATLAIATLLERFEIELADTRPPRPVGFMMIQPSYEPHFRLRERNGGR